MEYEQNSVLLVHWIDAFESLDRVSPSEAVNRPDADFQTVGFFLGSDDEFLYLSPSISSDQCSQLAIPLGCLKRVRKLPSGE